MKKLLIGLSALVVLFFSGCAPTAPTVPNKKDNIGKSFTTDKKYANVYLCRNSFAGSIWDMTVLVDGKFAGETTAYSHFHWKLKPGKHVIQSKADNIYSLELNTKSNTNYFIKQDMIMGMMKGGAELKIIDEEEGRKCVLATEMVKSKLHMSKYEQKTSIVEPTYVSPVKYDKYSCTEINKEVKQINKRAFKIAEHLKDVDRANRNIMSIGLISLLESATSEDERVELGKLNGEYNALKTVAKQKKCSFASTL